MKKVLLICFMFLSLLKAEDANLSQQELPDTWKFSAGAFLTGDFESSVDFQTDNGLSVALDFQKIFDMKTDLASFYLDGYYRFNEVHRIEMAWKGTRSGGTSKSAITIGSPGGIIGENNISTGVQSNLDVSILKLMYTYSFYHTKKMEVGLSAGAYYANFNIGMGAELGDFGGNFGFALGVPLPVIGLRTDYQITDKWSAQYTFDIFALSLGDLALTQNEEGSVPQYLLEHFTGFSGYMSEFTIGTEYRFFENFGVGGSLNYNLQDFSMKLSNFDDRGDFNLGVKNEVVGIALYGSMYF